MSEKEKTLADEAREFQKSKGTKRLIPEKDMLLVLTLIAPKYHELVKLGYSDEYIFRSAYETIKGMRDLKQ